MNREILILLILAALILLGSCAEGIKAEFKPLTNYEPPEREFPIYYTAGNGLYRSDLKGNSERIYFVANSTGFSKPRINYQANKVAFIDNTAGFPVIVDMEGNLIKALFDKTNTNEMCWSPDGESLIIIQNGGNNSNPPYSQTLSVWGDDYPLTGLDYIFNNTDRHLDALAISPSGRICEAYLTLRPFQSFGRNDFSLQQPGTNVNVGFSNGANRIRRLSFSSDTEELLAELSFEVLPGRPDHYVIENDDTVPWDTDPIDRVDGDNRQDLAFSLDGNLVSFIETGGGSTLQVYDRSTRRTTTIAEFSSATPMEADIK